MPLNTEPGYAIDSDSFAADIPAAAPAEVELIAPVATGPRVVHSIRVINNSVDTEFVRLYKKKGSLLVELPACAVPARAGILISTNVVPVYYYLNDAFAPGEEVDSQGNKRIDLGSGWGLYAIALEEPAAALRVSCDADILYTP